MVSPTITLNANGHLNEFGIQVLCNVGAGHLELYATVPPGGPAPAYPSTSAMPTRWIFTNDVQPDGTKRYYYAQGNSSYFSECSPDTIRVNSFIGYGWLQVPDPRSAILAAGYTQSPFVSIAWDYGYFANVGDFEHLLLTRRMFSSFYECVITTRYTKAITNYADMISVVPNPLVLTPLWNPGSMYFETTLA